ncbi:MAG TPA: hypothetical protein DCR44_07460 [Acholeplasmatales bacterium]|nr:MAG: hypothetical protein A2Y16_02140 [Tenericutes bacterium GWF2_57_13]HAQ57212.1 hypothetical protein [Acholeplasmatales bacterium]
MRRILILTVCALFAILAACDAATTRTTTTDTTGTTATTETTMTETTTQTTTQIADLIGRIDQLTTDPVVGALTEFGLYEPEGASSLALTYNPYDYTELSVVATFTKPSGATFRQYAFWYKEYDELRLIGAVYDEAGFLTAGQETVRWKDGGISHYRLRINPDEAGDWTYAVTVTAGTAPVQTITGGFTVAPSETIPDGIIGIDSTNGRTFVFASGETYLPVGANLAWWNTPLGTHDFQNWFRSLAMNGGNYGRIWLANWSLSLHKDSYDNFDTRQSVAIRIDHLLRMADEQGVWIMLTLLNHGQFSANVNPEWAANAYNSANGGMCDLPIEFFYKASAKAAYKNELLYILARYGYSDHIFAWELFNEVDWIDGYSDFVVTNWHDEMAKFIHANDPFDHLVTTSYKYTFGTPAYALSAIDFVAVHSYGYGGVTFFDKLIGEQKTLWNRYHKPIFFGEIGINYLSGSGTYAMDPYGVTIRQAAWGGLLGGGSGTAMHWWWDSWIERYDYWDRFLGAGTFATQMDLSGKAFTVLSDDGSAEPLTDGVGLLGIRTDAAVYGYVYNDLWSYWNHDPAAVSGVAVRIDLSAGDWVVDIYDAFTGLVLDTYAVTSTGAVTLIIGTVAQDLAFIARRAD